MTNKSLLLVYFFGIISNAHAYLDPGTGSIIIQGIIAAVLSITIAVKTYWFKIKFFFQRKKNK